MVQVIRRFGWISVLGAIALTCNVFPGVVDGVSGEVLSGGLFDVVVMVE